MRSMERRALIVRGGWEGHEPDKAAQVLHGALEQEGFAIEMSDSLEVLADRRRLMQLDLIVPHWTMGKITPQQLESVLDAVQSGVGLAGVHGGMCDAFRDAPEWHFMTGGQWVAHPGNDGVRYRVHITDADPLITRDIADFDVVSEQYYLHVDPAVKVLATTRFPVADGPHVPNGPVDMPVIWTKLFGRGRVYYNAIGHTAAVLRQEPVLTLVRRGFCWAAEGRRESSFSGPH